MKRLPSISQLTMLVVLLVGCHDAPAERDAVVAESPSASRIDEVADTNLTRSPAPTSSVEERVRRWPRFAVRGDSLDLADFLARFDYRIERELSRADGYVAVIARRPEEDAAVGDSVLHTVYDGEALRQEYLKWVGTSYVAGDRQVDLAAADSAPPFSFTEDAQRDGFGRVRELLLLHEGVDTLRLLIGPEAIGLYTPDTAAWMREDGGPVVGFRYTVNDPIEGGVWTRIFALAGDSLALVFGDDGRGCTPSELRDLDGDGDPELLAYGEHLFGGDCTHPCREAVRNAPRPPATAWPTVHRRNAPLQWEPAEAEYAAFYAELVREYVGMADRAVAEPACRYAPGADATLREWAARADSIAGSGAR